MFGLNGFLVSSISVNNFTTNKLAYDDMDLF